MKKLRETALKFVKDVRGSGAAEALAGSEAALADFAGTRAYEKAKEAAEILNRFVKRCQGEGGMGRAVPRRAGLPAQVVPNAWATPSRNCWPRWVSDRAAAWPWAAWARWGSTATRPA